MPDGNSSSLAFLKGKDTGTTSQDAFLKGASSALLSVSAFVQGATAVTTSATAFLYGGLVGTDSTPAYLSGFSTLHTSSRHAYLAGVVRSNIPAYLEGTHLQPGEPEMAYYDYIWLKSSDLSMQKKFRVLQAGYNDGQLTRPEQVKQTIGGGIDHSVGATYRDWNPTIRVRHTEPEADYGTLADLQAFYELSDPSTDPTMDITFVDNHGNNYVVHMFGGFQKSLLGTMIQGENAWYLVQLKLIEVT